MSYTPGAIELLVAAVDKSSAHRRAASLRDMRTARFAKDEDFDKLVHALERVGRGRR